jgi:hypothetical protein
LSFLLHIFEALKEFLLHTIEIQDAEALNFDILDSTNRKLSLKVVFLSIPLRNLEVLCSSASCDIDHSKMVSHFDFYVPSVVERWEHVRCLSFNQEVDVLDVISLEINILVICK